MTFSGASLSCLSSSGVLDKQLLDEVASRAFVGPFVDPWHVRLDARDHHLCAALRTGRPPNRHWMSWRVLGHGDLPALGWSSAISSHQAAGRKTAGPNETASGAAPIAGTHILHTASCRLVPESFFTRNNWYP